MLYIALRSRIVLIVDEWSLWLLRSSFWHEWCYFVKASQVLFSFRLFFHKWKSSLITDSLPYISIQIVLIKSWTSSQSTVLQDGLFAALRNNYWSLNFFKFWWFLKPKSPILWIFDNFFLIKMAKMVIF